MDRHEFPALSAETREGSLVDERVQHGKQAYTIAYAVGNFQKSDDQPDASWTRIGAAFIHKGGGGYDLVVDAIPVSGRIVRARPSLSPDDVT